MQYFCALFVDMSNNFDNIAYEKRSELYSFPLINISRFS